MKTLQNNFTTPEQSKQLLELGVPADSADCYYQNALPEPKIIPSGRKYQEYINSLTGINREIWYFKPCWSVGRLIEIYNMCVDFDLDDRAAIVIFIQDESPIVQMMEMFEDKVGIMDFSKLEE